VESTFSCHVQDEAFVIKDQAQYPLSPFYTFGVHNGSNKQVRSQHARTRRCGVRRSSCVNVVSNNSFVTAIICCWLPGQVLGAFASMPCLRIEQGRCINSLSYRQHSQGVQCHNKPGLQGSPMACVWKI